MSKIEFFTPSDPEGWRYIEMWEALERKEELSLAAEPDILAIGEH